MQPVARPATDRDADPDRRILALTYYPRYGRRDPDRVVACHVRRLYDDGGTALDEASPDEYRRVLAIARHGDAARRDRDHRRDADPAHEHADRAAHPAAPA